MRVAVDGHPVASYRRGIDVLERGFHLKNPYNGSFSSICPSSVIRPGEQVALFSLSRLPVKEFGSMHRRVMLEVCYCSLLGQCWSVTAQKPRESVSGCAHQNGSIDY